MKQFLMWLLYLLHDFFLGWLFGIIRLASEYAEKRRHRQRVEEDGHRSRRCQVIPPTIYKRPDPMIYSQSYLMAQGLAVTWDNPDIHLFEVGSGPGFVLTPVASNAVRPNTEYEIQASIYNGSWEAPVINLPVEVSYLSFGIGAASHAIGRTRVDLPVNGAAGHPAMARMRWRTPAVPGHYCIQVKLIWADDANPDNNLGQDNLVVGEAQSPAEVAFVVGNRNRFPETIRLEEDAYAIPALLRCDEIEPPTAWKLWTRTGDREDRQKDERREWCARLAERHKRERFPVPAGWTVELEPRRFIVPEGGEQLVTARITPPNGFTGVRAFNINGFNDTNSLLGGITLYVRHEI